MVFMQVGTGETLNTDSYDPANPILVEGAELKEEYFKQTGSDIPEWMHPEELVAGYIGRFLAGQTTGLNNPEVMEKLMNIFPYYKINIPMYYLNFIQILDLILFINHQ